MRIRDCSEDNLSLYLSLSLSLSPSLSIDRSIDRSIYLSLPPSLPPSPRPPFSSPLLSPSLLNRLSVQQPPPFARPLSSSACNHFHLAVFRSLLRHKAATMTGSDGDRRRQDDNRQYIARRRINTSCEAPRRSQASAEMAKSATSRPPQCFMPSAICPGCTTIGMCNNRSATMFLQFR